MAHNIEADTAMLMDGEDVTPGTPTLCTVCGITNPDPNGACNG